MDQTTLIDDIAGFGEKHKGRPRILAVVARSIADGHAIGAFEDGWLDFIDKRLQ